MPGESELMAQNRPSDAADGGRPEPDWRGGVATAFAFTEKRSALAATVPDVPDASDIRVSPEQILAVAKVIEDQAGALAEKIRDQLGALAIDPPAEDPVSTNAVKGWNQTIALGEGSYATRVTQYVEDLRGLAEQLRRAAGHYQAGEEDKREVFDDRGVYEA